MFGTRFWMCMLTCPLWILAAIYIYIYIYEMPLEHPPQEEMCTEDIPIYVGASGVGPAIYATDL